jgi:hypothetical protein
LICPVKEAVKSMPYSMDSQGLLSCKLPYPQLLSAGIKLLLNHISRLGRRSSKHQAVFPVGTHVDCWTVEITQICSTVLHLNNNLKLSVIFIFVTPLLSKTRKANLHTQSDPFLTMEDSSWVLLYMFN